MKIIKLTNKVLNPIGAQLVKYPYSDINRRLKLLEFFKINKVFDVGANIGRYVIDLRSLGFKGEVISFEPLSKTFKALENNSKKDIHWTALNYALGDKDLTTEINISSNTDSSSLLEMLPSHLESAPQSEYIGKEKIKLHKLDTVFKEFYNQNDQIYMKLDTQGFEKNVLDGAQDSLEKIKGIQIEMSLKPLYKGGILYLEIIDLMKSNGFELYSLENGFSNPNTGQLLQVDGVFFRDQ